MYFPFSIHISAMIIQNKIRFIKYLVIFVSLCGSFQYSSSQGFGQMGGGMKGDGTMGQGAMGQSGGGGEMSGGGISGAQDKPAFDMGMIMSKLQARKLSKLTCF